MGRERSAGGGDAGNFRKTKSQGNLSFAVHRHPKRTWILRIRYEQGAVRSQKTNFYLGRASGNGGFTSLDLSCERTSQAKIRHGMKENPSHLKKLIRSGNIATHLQQVLSTTIEIEASAPGVIFRCVASRACAQTELGTQHHASFHCAEGQQLQARFIALLVRTLTLLYANLPNQYAVFVFSPRVTRNTCLLLHDAHGVSDPSAERTARWCASRQNKSRFHLNATDTRQRHSYLVPQNFYLFSCHSVASERTRPKAIAHPTAEPKNHRIYLHD